MSEKNSASSPTPTYQIHLSPSRRVTSGSKTIRELVRQNTAETTPQPAERKQVSPKFIAVSISPARPDPSPSRRPSVPHVPIKPEVPVQGRSPKVTPGRTRTPRYTSPTRRLLPATPGTEEATDPETKSSVKALEAQRQRLEDQGAYLEAEVVHQQLMELKLAGETKRKEQIRKQHLEELLGVEEAHLQTFTEFNDKWDEEMRIFEERSAKATAEQKTRHDQALADLRREIEAHIEQAIASRAFPPTKHLLDLRKSEKALARQREYRQAHALKQAADAVEEREINERIVRLRASFQGKEDRLREKNALETGVLLQKIATERAQLEEGRKVELDALLLRYRNIKSEMESGAARAEVAVDQRIAMLSPQMPTAVSKSPGGVAKEG